MQLIILPVFYPIHLLKFYDLLSLIVLQFDIPHVMNDATIVALLCCDG